MYTHDKWCGGSVGWALNLYGLHRGFVSRYGRGCKTTLGMLFKPLYPCHQAVQFGTGQWASSLTGWEGNCRPGVAMIMRCFNYLWHLWAQSLEKRDKRPVSTPLGIRHDLPLCFIHDTICICRALVVACHSCSTLLAIQ